jgi:hypothetical protein
MVKTALEDTKVLLINIIGMFLIISDFFELENGMSAYNRIIDRQLVIGEF